MRKQLLFELEVDGPTENLGIRMIREAAEAALAEVSAPKVQAPAPEV
jgi:hypothetical protein